jgi:hypothetical protein
MQMQPQGLRGEGIDACLDCAQSPTYMASLDRSPSADPPGCDARCRLCGSASSHPIPSHAGLLSTAAPNDQWYSQFTENLQVLESFNGDLNIEHSFITGGDKGDENQNLEICK